ncbi:uncharacterized protein LOC122027250 [Zingiber officinale]|uniref:uncharacterized protein LOC122027250 n=1 Tax=Zingiber officinale TaxID=94328 RepID=UPI001C4B5228|nr:uncharacterized protein LOC122027250 [Zingiber officinale]
MEWSVIDWIRIGCNPISVNPQFVRHPIADYLFEALTHTHSVTPPPPLSKPYFPFRSPYSSHLRSSRSSDDPRETVGPLFRPANCSPSLVLLSGHSHGRRCRNWPSLAYSSRQICASSGILNQRLLPTSGSSPSSTPESGSKLYCRVTE